MESELPRCGQMALCLKESMASLLQLKWQRTVFLEQEAPHSITEFPNAHRVQHGNSHEGVVHRD